MRRSRFSRSFRNRAAGWSVALFVMAVAAYVALLAWGLTNSPPGEGSIPVWAAAAVTVPCVGTALWAMFWLRRIGVYLTNDEMRIINPHSSHRISRRDVQRIDTVPISRGRTKVYVVRTDGKRIRAVGVDSSSFSFGKNKIAAALADAVSEWLATSDRPHGARAAARASPTAAP